MQGPQIKTEPWCPFCGEKIPKPLPPVQRKLGEFSSGTCSCGAVYTSDPTGFNQGAAMVEALVHACHDNWDFAWELSADDDYLTDRIERYDEPTHQVLEIGKLDGRRVKGVLLFVRLNPDIAAELGELGKPSGRPAALRTGPPLPPMEPERDPHRTRKRADKSLVQHLAEGMDIDGLVDLAFDDAKTIRFLLRLLYTPDEAKRWRTVEVLARVCARVSTRKPGMVSDLLHRLFAACVDSASSSWGAVEAIGAIIGMRPDIFGSFTRHLLQFLADSGLQPQVLWSLGTIAKYRPDLIRSLPIYNLFNFIDHPEPAVRGLALRLLGRIKGHEARGGIAALSEDGTPVTIFEEGEPVATDIGALACEALRLIDQEGGKAE